jgi:protoheme IX farnesyltransferase
MSTAMPTAHHEPVVTVPSLSQVMADVMALTKPRLTLGVVITAAGGVYLAPGKIPWTLALGALFLIGMVVAAAHTLNCYLERDADALMHRTRNRPLPAGRLHPRVALFFGLSLTLMSLPALSLLTNPLTGFLGAIALISYVLVYTPMKPKSSHALFVGAIPGAIPPLMGWTAVTGRISAPGLVLFAIMFLWQVPHFVAIAIFCKDDYARAGHRVLPLEKGDTFAVVTSLVGCALLVPVSLLPYFLEVAGPLYLGVASVLGAAFLGYCVMALRVRHLGVQFYRRLFFASLAYIMVLFIAMILARRG